MLRLLLSTLIVTTLLSAAQPDVLPGTSRWDFPADIVAEQYAELEGYLNAEIRLALDKRQPFTDIAGAREELRRMIGAIDTFLPRQPKREEIGRLGAIKVSLVEWPLLPIGSTPPTRGSAGTLVRQFGILLEPDGEQPHPAVVSLADADQSAADIAGLTSRLSPGTQFARRLAEKGYIVYAPFFTERRAFSEPWTNDRSWLFRLAYQTGHHLIGSEAQQVVAAREYLESLPSVDKSKIAIAGSGQGGMLALYSAAIEPRFTAAWISGYSDKREHLADEPEDRIVWGFAHYGDAGLASLVAPCRLLMQGGLEELDAALGYTPSKVDASGSLTLDPDRLARIANFQFSGWQAWYRNAALEAYATREASWRPDTSSIENYRKWAQPKLEEYLDRIGRYPKGDGPLDPRSVKVYDNDELTAYRLSLRLYEGVHEYGIVAIPKNMKPGERRPLVFVQHGQGGKPEDALGIEPNARADAVYSRFGLALLRRGYIVFAPMISTQATAGRDRVSKRTQLLGRSIVGIEVRKFGRALDFFSTLPFVDSSRFGFYGLSYGGYTALWAAPAEPRFKVVVSSGHFNDWDVKTSDITQGTSFLFYPEVFDMFSFGLLPRFSHSEIAMLVAPRPFMIEAGDRDGVIIAPRRFADLEMSRVEDLYRRLGIPEKGRVARFDGPHRIDGAEAYPFIDRWLDWKPVAQ
jgi:dienelactone hydrolase